MATVKINRDRSIIFQWRESERGVRGISHKNTNFSDWKTAGRAWPYDCWRENSPRQSAQGSWKYVKVCEGKSRWSGLVIGIVLAEES